MKKGKKKPYLLLWNPLQEFLGYSVGLTDPGDTLLLETGDDILLESGDYLLLEG